jgi:methylmalonyl-CoA/ethylmalonyl-CoA epimerase
MNTAIELQKSPLGAIDEICLVTPDIRKTIQSLSPLITPFKIYRFDSTTVRNRTLRGQSANFELLVAFAQHKDLVVELMQPLSSDSLMGEYLSKHSEGGIQHVAWKMEGPMSERKESMRERGFEVAMEGVWMGKRGECHFVFFDTSGGIGTVFETIEFSEDWEEPNGEVFPA